MSKSKGLIWPYAIGTSIVFIFFACVATVIVSFELPVEKSDTYMMGYHEANAKANDIIEAEIAFNKKYKVQYITEQFSVDDAALKYRVVDTNNNAVDNAEITAVITRPNKHEFNQEIQVSKGQNGVYTFDSVKLPKEGRWDVMAKIKVGQDQRFYNVKVDTRHKEVKVY